MQTRLDKRGPIVVPETVRRRHGLHERDHLVWLDVGQTITVIPVPAEAIRALGGRGRGEGLVKESFFRGKYDSPGV
jgi:bifunctional DNA-binding transcriptional regulator/antitoxin component of YhaV-PrlF toxin-antitoxin module